jgi:hypothetical protein
MSSLQTRLFALFFLTYLISCKEGTDERHQIIAGTWYLKSAQADGAATQRLDGTIFTFSEGRISTNVPQIGEGAYHFAKNKLIQKGEPNITYTIESLDNNALVLSMTLREVDFRMEFDRVEPSAEN